MFDAADIGIVGDALEVATLLAAELDQVQVGIVG